MRTAEGRARSSDLSKREVEVLRLGALGATDGEISDRLSISVPTLRTYWLRIRNKIGGINRTHAIALAVAGPLAEDHDPERHLLTKAREESLAEWVWRPAKRQVVLDDRAKTFFGLVSEEDTLPLDHLLEVVWTPDRSRFERFLAQSTEVGPLTPIDVRIGASGDFRRSVRTANLLTHRTKSTGTNVLFVSTACQSG